mmetsp:Transcript_21593/g.42936  ORF Transcript_21593/g.42936 Transcript_21593/m.42936 type:complete len:87 (+) Transcript_21593:126-386(+)
MKSPCECHLIERAGTVYRIAIRLVGRADGLQAEILANVQVSDPPSWALKKWARQEAEKAKREGMVSRGLERPEGRKNQCFQWRERE